MRVFFVVLASLFSSWACANVPQADLSAVRKQIKDMQQDIRAKEADRTEAMNALKVSEMAVSEARRVLNSLEQTKHKSENERARVERAMTESSRNIERAKQRIAQVLASTYRQGERDPLQLWLSQKDPGQSARDLVYQHYFNRAQQQVIDSLRKERIELESLSAKLAQEMAHLQKISREHRAQAQKFEQEKRRRAQVVARISEDIRYQRQEVNKLQRDEQRLTGLIIDLNRTLARKKQELQRNQSTRSTSKTPSRESGGLTAEDVALKPNARAQNRSAAHESRSFSSQKSGMKLPVSGQVIGQFGGERGQGARWRGIFIQTHSGRSVRSIASGEVVYANWLRGFGNIIIVDHGGSFMSIYGSAEALLKRVGERVKQGEAVATTGASGGSELSGIYFELRQHGEPIDPLKWASK